MTVAEVLAANIKIRRNELGMSQQELADKVGVTKGAIAQYESGNSGIKLTNITKLADALNVTEHYLVTEQAGNVSGQQMNRSGSNNTQAQGSFNQSGSAELVQVIASQARQIGEQAQQITNLHRELNECRQALYANR